MDQAVCKRVWYTDDFEWAFKGSDGRSGDLLSIWDSTKFSQVSVHEGDGFLIVEGLWGINRTACYLTNIYAPCTRTGRRSLWNNLK